jgi:hypothetical protein
MVMTISAASSTANTAAQAPCQASHGSEPNTMT